MFPELSSAKIAFLYINKKSFDESMLTTGAFLIKAFQATVKNIY